MPLVSIIKGMNAPEMTIEAMELVEAQDILVEGKPVLIKPNYINSRHPSTGVTTDKLVIEGVIRFLQQHGVEDIIIGEGSGHSNTFKAYEVAGVDLLADEYGVKLIDLNEDEFVEVFTENPLALKRVKVAKTALESTIISVPKLKLHRITGVTLGIKNMMGGIKAKGTMHTGSLSKNIADIASIIKPSIVIVDGVIGGEGHETSNDPVEMNLVIAGLDPVAVDSVGAMVMGIPPDSIKHLGYSVKKGLGTYDLDQIDVVGEPIEKVYKKFRKALSSRILSLLA